jgi:hypothetical protein
LIEAGVLFDPSLPSAEQELLAAFARSRSLKCKTEAAFVDDVFYALAYDLRATIVGFNLPFDLSRLAVHETAKQQPLKIIANATSYGIFVELIVEDLDKKETLLGNDGFPVEVEIAETPGRYFHPLLATLITGAARLMLAITERLLVDAGLDWAFCDTDSMAIAKRLDGDRPAGRPAGCWLSDDRAAAGGAIGCCARRGGTGGAAAADVGSAHPAAPGRGRSQQNTIARRQHSTLQTLRRKPKLVFKRRCAITTFPSS